MRRGTVEYECRKHFMLQCNWEEVSYQLAWEVGSQNVLSLRCLCTDENVSMGRAVGEERRKMPGGIS